MSIFTTLERMTSPESIADMYRHAVQPGLKPIPLPETQESIEEAMQGNEWLEEVEQREEIEVILQTTTVSDEVREQCQREMREAERRGWRIR